MGRPGGRGIPAGQFAGGGARGAEGAEGGGGGGCMWRSVDQVSQRCG